jgi:hypothetical protein
MPTVFTEYPKFVEFKGERILVKSEDELIELENNEDRQQMMADLASAGKKVDGRQYKGPSGLGSLRAYYEAVIGNSNDSSDDDS